MLAETVPLGMALFMFSQSLNIVMLIVFYLSGLASLSGEIAWVIVCLHIGSDCK